jgi:hypothetical protein
VSSWFAAPRDHEGADEKGAATSLTELIDFVAAYTLLRQEIEKLILDEFSVVTLYITKNYE